MPSSFGGLFGFSYSRLDIIFFYNCYEMAYSALISLVSLHVTSLSYLHSHN